MHHFLAFLTILQALASPGYAVYYAESWDWQRIAANQGVEIPAHFTPIAVPNCADLGRTGLLWLDSDNFPIMVIVADCTADQHLAWVRERGIIAEVPYHVAKSRRFVYNGKARARLLLWPKEGR